MMVINKDIIELIIIMDLMLAPAQIIMSGPSATLGRELRIVRKGSNTFAKNSFHQRIVAINNPKKKVIKKLMITS